jgi:hypothetical protein
VIYITYIPIYIFCLKTRKKFDVYHIF